MKLGSKLKELRIRKNLTQIEVAKHFNLSKNDIRDFEEGVQTPSPELLREFSKFYAIDYERLRYDYLNLYEIQKGKKDVFVFLLLNMVTIFNTLLVLLLLFFLDERVITGVEEGIVAGKYVNKYYTLLFLFPFIGFYLVCLFVRLNNKYNRKLIFNIDLANLILEIIVGILAILFYYINIKDINMISQNLFYSIIGILFFVLGFSVHPLINRPKAILGYRSRFTLGNDEAWYKVNTFLSYSVIISSVVFIILNIFVRNYYVIFFMLLPFVLTVIYHEILKFQANFLDNIK